MKLLLAGIPILWGLSLCAGNVQLQVEATAYPGQQVTLYRYLDPFTGRLAAMAKGYTDDAGHVELDADVTGTQRALLLVGTVGAHLWLRPGTYHAQMPAPTDGQVRPMGGSARVDLIFPDLDPLDVNALVSDLNGRLDAFLAEGLATDQDAAMRAVTEARDGSGGLQRDTTDAADIYLYPAWKKARVDSFAAKLTKFYQEVEDPWFQQDLKYGIAGLYLGPTAHERELFTRFLKDRPVLYDVPEYVRFFSAFYRDHLLRHPFRHETAKLQQAVRDGQVDSLKALLGRNDFLKDDRVCELVLLINLYENVAHPQLDRAGILKVLRQVQEHSIYAEHRAIAENMLWDLTAMAAGTPLPPARLLGADGEAMGMEVLLEGPVCLMIARAGNPYSDRELIALDQMAGEYGGEIRFVHVLLDQTAESLSAWLATRPEGLGYWAVPTDQRELMDQWRIKNAPVLFLLQDGLLTASPAPLPSAGLVAELHRMRVGEQRQQQINRDRAKPSPKR